jgi:ABC-type sugar transport system ATPase subunit
MANVKLVGVRKIYEERGRTHVAVHDLDLDIGDGEFVVLVGPSGCGKSTTLRMIAGLESISAGVLYIGDRRVNDIPPKHRDIAMVFQNYALYPHMTAYENMAFALRLRHLAGVEVDRRVRASAQVLGIEPLLQRRPRQMSGGERQRVALGRAIVRQPQVFLFDEPLSNLDAKLRVQMRREIARLHRQLGATMIYVTHDQVEAMTLGDRIAVLSAGHLQQVASPGTLYAQPANTFVASFIGTPPMNLILGRLLAGSPPLFEGAEGLRLEVDRSWEGALGGAAERPVILGIRPEELIPATGPDDGVRAIDTRVELVELLGGEALVHLTHGSVELTARLPAPAPQAGESFRFSVPSAGIHLFDAMTTARLAP